MFIANSKLPKKEIKMLLLVNLLKPGGNFTYRQV
jgi:hypothetical protein